MKKIMFDQITMHKVEASDAALKLAIPRLAYEQAQAHEVYFEKEIISKAHANFSEVVSTNGVDLWMIKEPYYASGAIFTSPLKANGKLGLQGEDAVILPEYRGMGLASALISFRARLAKENGLSFVGWECEDGDSDLIHQRHEVFKAMGGKKRSGLKPFRISKDLIDKTHLDAKPIINFKTIYPYALMPVIDFYWEGGSASVSQRFSIFRTLARGNTDGDYNQESNGIQIEDLKFNDLKTAKNAIGDIVKICSDTLNGCVFADIVVDENKPEQLELVGMFDAEQNTYSGNPSFLWILEGDAFEKAAARAQILKIG